MASRAVAGGGANSSSGTMDCGTFARHGATKGIEIAPATTLTTCSSPRLPGRVGTGSLRSWWLMGTREPKHSLDSRLCWCDTRRTSERGAEVADDVLSQSGPLTVRPGFMRPSTPLTVGSVTAAASSKTPRTAGLFWPSRFVSRSALSLQRFAMRNSRSHRHRPCDTTKPDSGSP